MVFLMVFSENLEKNRKIIVLFSTLKMWFIRDRALSCLRKTGNKTEKSCYNDVAKKRRLGTTKNLNCISGFWLLKNGIEQNEIID
jgi:hypothetical protein